MVVRAPAVSIGEVDRAGAAVGALDGERAGEAIGSCGRSAGVGQAAHQARLNSIAHAGAGSGDLDARIHAGGGISRCLSSGEAGGQAEARAVDGVDQSLGRVIC